MYIELADLFILCVVFLGLYYWFSAQKVREMALKAARRECEKMDLQLLDGSVSLTAIKLKRADSGLVKLARRYQFEFSSTGDERYRGTLNLLGMKVTGIELQAHRIND